LKHANIRSEAPSFVRAAAREPGRSLDIGVRRSIEARTGHDFGRIRVHDGPASEAAAREYGANALTIGRDVYLGEPVARMPPAERNRVLVHESIHAVQQGERSVDRADRLPVSTPGDGAEREAHAISSFPLTHANVSSLGGPMIQRDLTDTHKVDQGQFKMNMKTISNPGGKNGLKGTIQFHASDKAPDAKKIRLFQVLRTQDLAGKDDPWAGKDADRNKFNTKADPSRGIEAGYSMDVDPSKVKPRTKKSDAPVSRFYRDYWPNASSSQDGSKSGKNIQDASLWDFPGASYNLKFSFETVAQDADTNHTYGTVMWGFTIKDASAGTVTDERSVGRNVTLATTDAAVKSFNEFYKNPGSKSAPTK
jgi:hypothetical protein